MFGEKKLKQVAKQALSYSKADQTSLRQGYGRQAEVIIFVYDRGLTRFANSQIHQNVAADLASVQVRAVVGPSAQRLAQGSGRGAKIGVASANSLAKDSLKKVVEKAYQLARLQKVDPHFISLPAPTAIQKINSFSEKTAKLTPAAKAKMVADVIKVAKDAKLTASGAFDTDIAEIGIANSLGVWAYHASTSANLTTIFLGEDSTGYAGEAATDVSKIKYQEVAKKAAEKALKSRKPVEIKPGDYEVVLEPAALDEVLFYFSWLGPNARIYHEEASFLTGKLGQKVFSENLTITEDAYDERGFPMPFDFEGVPKKSLPIVEKGVFKNVVYDSYHAGKHSGELTGHALPAPNTWGPIPGHLRIEPGDKALEEMIKDVKKGLLVTRFWYIRMLHPKLMNITGMTRDGTFLIRNGEIVGAVKNMRFTQSTPEAFSNVVSVGHDLKLEASHGQSNLVPAVHISSWHFSGVTQF